MKNKILFLIVVFVLVSLVSSSAQDFVENPNGVTLTGQTYTGEKEVDAGATKEHQEGCVKIVDAARCITGQYAYSGSNWLGLGKKSDKSECISAATQSANSIASQGNEVTVDYLFSERFGCCSVKLISKKYCESDEQVVDYFVSSSDDQKISDAKCDQKSDGSVVVKVAGFMQQEFKATKDVKYSCRGNQVIETPCKGSIVIEKRKLPDGTVVIEKKKDQPTESRKGCCIVESGGDVKLVPNKLEIECVVAKGKFTGGNCPTSVPKECPECPSCDNYNKQKDADSTPMDAVFSLPYPIPVGQDSENKKPKCGNKVQEKGEDFDVGNDQAAAEQACKQNRRAGASGSVKANVKACKCIDTQQRPSAEKECLIFKKNGPWPEKADVGLLGIAKEDKLEKQESESIEQKSFGFTGAVITGMPIKISKDADIIENKDGSFTVANEDGSSYAFVCLDDECKERFETSYTTKEGYTETYSESEDGQIIAKNNQDDSFYTFINDKNKQRFVTSSTSVIDQGFLKAKKYVTEFYEKTNKGIMVTNSEDDTYYIYKEDKIKSADGTSRKIKNIIESRREDGVVENYEKQDDKTFIKRSDGTNAVKEKYNTGEIDQEGNPIIVERIVSEKDKDGKTTTYVYLPKGITRAISDDGSYQSYVIEDGKAFVVESANEKGEKSFFAKLKDGSIHVTSDKDGTSSQDYIILSSGEQFTTRYTTSDGQTFRQELLQNGLIKVYPAEYFYDSSVFASGHPYYKDLPPVEKGILASVGGFFSDLFNDIASLFKEKEPIKKIVVKDVVKSPGVEMITGYQTFETTERTDKIKTDEGLKKSVDIATEAKPVYDQTLPGRGEIPTEIDQQISTREKPVLEKQAVDWKWMIKDKDCDGRTYVVQKSGEKEVYVYS